MINRLSSLLLFMLVHVTVIAQKPVASKPVDTREAFFMYAEFSMANGPRMKVVLLTSYIYRVKYIY
jgi:hypothetical protein